MSMWKDVEGFEELYEVSNTGQLRSKASHVAGIKVDGYIDRQHKAENGGREFHLLRGDETTVIPCHELVMSVYRGPTPEGMTIRHISGEVSDNRTSNLVFWPIESPKDAPRTNAELSRSVAPAAPAAVVEQAPVEPEVVAEQPRDPEPVLVVFDKDITSEKPSGGVSKKSLGLIFRLRYVDGLSFAKIATAVGVTPQTISNVIRGKSWVKATKALRAKYENQT